MRNLFILTLSLFLIISCNRSGRQIPTSLSVDSLSIYSAEILTTTDTTLQLPGGSLIEIQANTLEAAGAAHVKLQIREALKISDIIKAGLLTNSNGQRLSSGGMIEIRAAEGQSVTIKKALKIKLPTPFRQKDMQLFKGEVNKDGKLNWVSPQPVKQDTLLERGSMLFASCAPCHGLKDKVTGPELAYIDRRRPRHWLDHFISNSQQFLNAEDYYAHCLYERYNRTPMPPFPALTDDDLEALYRYIDNESARQNLPMPHDTFYKCTDSCRAYASARNELESRRQKLIDDNNERAIISRDPVTQAGINTRDKAPGLPKVAAPVFQSEYYEFEIKTFGWFNIDIMLKQTDAVESKLVVRLQGEYASVVNVYLAIPSIKVFDAGGSLETSPTEFGFYAPDGTLPLP